MARSRTQTTSARVGRTRRPPAAFLLPITQGEEISLGGRLLAVVDVFDTLAFEARPYQQVEWTVDETLDELRSCVGDQFDPDAVAGFTAMLEDEPWMRREEQLIRGAKGLLD